MAEPKLEEIKKEKLDDIYIDDKELINKNKKKPKGKGNKKNKPIDLFEYAKENGLDINIQYEETKPMEFPKEYNKKNDNYKFNNIKKVENRNRNDDKKKENNYEKEDEKEKNNDYEYNKYGNKGYDNKKNYDFEYDNYENKHNNYEYDNYDYNQRNNDSNYNYDYEDNNYYNNYNNDNYYGDKRYKNNKNDGNNNYYNYNRNYHYKKNYNNNYNNNYYNDSYYDNYKKKSDIAVELPDPVNDKKNNEEKNEESNNNNINEKNSQNMNIKNKANQINQINMYNNMFNYMQASLMSNYQAELMRMNYISNMEHLNSNLYTPYMSPIPSTDESKVELLEKSFSEKNLNRDLNLRKNMDPDTGDVPIDFILNLNKIHSMNLNEKTINELINKIGSDIIEVIKQGDKLYLRRKNFEEIKNKLKSIEDMEKEFQQKINKQEQYQHNIQMNPQPIVFFPIQPIMFFGQMMVPSQQRNIQNQPGVAFPVSNSSNNNQNK